MAETAAERTARIMSGGAEATEAPMGVAGDCDADEEVFDESQDYDDGGGCDDADELPPVDEDDDDDGDEDDVSLGFDDDSDCDAADTQDLLAAQRPHVDLDEMVEEGGDYDGDDLDEDMHPSHPLRHMHPHLAHHPAVHVAVARAHAVKRRAASNLLARVKHGDPKAHNVIKNLGHAMQMGVKGAREALGHLFHLHKSTQPQHPMHGPAKSLYVNVMTGHPHAAIALSKVHQLACQGNPHARVFVQQFHQIHAEEHANAKREAAERLYARLRHGDTQAWHAAAIMMRLRSQGNAEAAASYELLKKVHFDTNVARKDWQHAKLADHFYARFQRKDAHAWAQLALIYKAARSGHPVAKEAKNAVIEAQARANGEAPKLPPTPPAVAVTSMPPLVNVARPTVTVAPATPPKVTVSGMGGGCECNTRQLAAY